jgi:hypothetical protein
MLAPGCVLIVVRVLGKSTLTAGFEGSEAARKVIDEAVNRINNA